MLLQADAKQLEWVGATYLSQDQVAIDEILNGVDQHADNQQRFGLPSRLIAKTFVFRLIYGGSAYSYANDLNFSSIGDETFWQGVIDQFYEKYAGLKVWHEQLLERAMRDGRIDMPTGRFYKFEPEVKYGKVKFPRTKILNYPVQGLGADLMALARVSLRNRLKGKEGVLMVNTVHDSIILDVDINKVSCYNISKIVNDCFMDVPKNFQKIFGQEFNLPMRVEIQVGPNWKDMEVYEVGN